MSSFSVFSYIPFTLKTTPLKIVDTFPGCRKFHTKRKKLLRINQIQKTQTCRKLAETYTAIAEKKYNKTGKLNVFVGKN